MIRSLLLPPSSRLWPVKRAGICLLLLAASLAMAACGEISVQDEMPAPPQQGSAARETAAASGTVHDLSILGVDFDPPLDIERIVRREQVKLIVGVMNLGNSRETRVRVNASLWDADERLVLARASQTVGSIAAGDVVPARLVTNDTPPVYSHYKLKVEIVPLADEISTDNNRRTLDITVNTGR